MGSKKITIAILTIVVITVYTLSGCNLKDKTQSEEVNPIPVSVKEVESKKTEKVEKFIGTTSGSKELNIVPKIAGKVQAIYVVPGEIVKKDQVLIKIEDEDVKLSLRQAELGYQVALSNLTQARQGKDSQSLQAKLQLKQAENGYQQAIDALKQAEELYEKKAIPESQLNQAKSAFLQAENGLKLARDTVEKTKSIESLKAIEAQLEQAKINVEKARSALEGTKIKASFDGQIAAILVKEGAIASPQMPVIQLVNQRNTIVKLNISESSLSLYKVGNEVSVTIPYMEETVRGVITFIAPVASQTLTFPVEIQLDSPASVKAGLLAEIVVKEISNEEQLVIPTQAVLGSNQANYVYVIEGNVAKKRDIKISEMTSTITIVKSGLQEKELIVIKGQHELINDVLIEIIKEEGQES